MLNDETLVDKEGMVDANVNDAIDGDCFVCWLRSQRRKVAQSKKEWKVEKNWESKRELVGFVKNHQYNVYQLFIFVGVILSFWQYYANE